MSTGFRRNPLEKKVTDIVQDISCCLHHAAKLGLIDNHGALMSGNGIAIFRFLSLVIAYKARKKH